MDTADDKNYSFRAALDDIKTTFARQSERILISREIAKTILTSASVIVSVLGAFASFRESDALPSSWQLVMLISASILFALLVLTCVYLLLPAPFLGPIKATKETYENEVFDKTEKDTLLILFSAYLNVVQLNEPIIKARNKWTWISGVLLILIVICLMVYIII